MLLTAKAGELAAAAKVAASAADSKAKIPIVGALLCEAAGGAIKFTGTNLDMAMVAETVAVVKEPGCSAVPAETLSKLLAGITADRDVTMETIDAGVRVQAGRSRYQLPVLPPDDFPQAPIVSGDTKLVLSRDQVRHLFGATAFAISNEETRYYLNGTYLHVIEGRLCAVATNGTMLVRAVADIDLAPDILPAAGVIIPRRAVEQIIKFKANKIRIRIDAKALSAQADTILLTSKLIDGTYPDYHRVIPAQTNIVAELERAALLAAIERIAAISKNKKLATLTLSWNGDDGLRLAMADGEVAEDIIVAATAGEAKIAFAVSRFLEAVEAVDADRLRLGIASVADPIRISPADNRDLLAILMPCRPEGTW